MLLCQLLTVLCSYPVDGASDCDCRLLAVLIYVVSTDQAATVRSLRDNKGRVSRGRDMAEKVMSMLH
jgi:hypothetical protein